MNGEKLVKLEVLGDEKTLYPNTLETLKAADILVKEGFKVMVYTTDDPLVAKELENIGCISVMPLASPIGSGLGLRIPFPIVDVLRFDYGWGYHDGKWNNGTFHFGVGQKF